MTAQELGEAYIHLTLTPKQKGLKIRATPVTDEHSPGNPRGMGEAKEA